MKKPGLIVLIIINIACYGQVSYNVAMRCGSKSEKAMEYFNLANWGLSTNQLNGSKNFYLKAIHEDSLFCDAWDNLSICCRRMGNYEDAFTSGLHSLIIDSTNASAWSNCGYAAFLNNDIYRALTSFDHLQRIIPSDPEGYYGKSMVLYSIDSISEARINIYKADMKYKTSNIRKGPEVDLLKGFIEYKSGNKKLAQTIFEDIYSKFKKNPELNYFLGKCLLENDNNIKKSQKYIDKAIKLGYVMPNGTTKQDNK
ncbi:MAG: hypothetical protein M0R21_08965 [Lentimicrobiaceae bacterium]|jgi:tetratricopeptide (TPR) repeat protein|nr:hypothetical protein [Lentimicrobiaceae bacterium]